MSTKKILDDAEDLKIRNKKIISIGDKISPTNFPKYQLYGNYKKIKN